MPDPLRSGGWLLLYDYCMTNRFGLSSSSDLSHWSVEEGVSFPPDARHGSVARLTASEAERLQGAFPTAVGANAGTKDGNLTHPSTPGTASVVASPP